MTTPARIYSLDPMADSYGRPIAAVYSARGQLVGWTRADMTHSRTLSPDPDRCYPTQPMARPLTDPERADRGLAVQDMTPADASALECRATADPDLSYGYALDCVRVTGHAGPHISAVGTRW